MKFLATAAAALLPMTALAISVTSTPGLPGVNATIDVDGDGDVDITLSDLGLSGPINVVETLFDLLDNGKIDLVDDYGCTGNNTHAISKRSDVPFLHCGYARATRCALSTSGVLVTCFWAAIQTGKDIKEDSKCAAAIIALGSNIPSDCKLCLGISF